MPPLGFELATFESGTQRFVYRAKAPFDIYRIHMYNYTYIYIYIYIYIYV